MATTGTARGSLCYCSGVVVNTATAFLGLALAAAPALAAESDLVISELMAANRSTLRDADGDSPDWFEIHNRGEKSVLTTLYVTDDPAVPAKWKLPPTRLGRGEYLVVFASGKDRRDGDEFHTNFRLRRSGEYLALVAADRTTVISEYKTFPALPDGVSYGLDRKLRLRAFQRPTPGTRNENGIEVAATPVLTPTGTLFGSKVTVRQITEAAETTFRYTTGGNEPTRGSRVFPEKLVLNSSTLLLVKGFRKGALPSQTVTRGFIGIDRSLAKVNSNVPLILIDTFGKPLAGKRRQRFRVLEYQPAMMAVFEPTTKTARDGDDRKGKNKGKEESKGKGKKPKRSTARLTPGLAADAFSQIAMRVRGASTAIRSKVPKRSYRVELRRPDGSDRKLSLLGMPKDSDWILYGSHLWDRSLVRMPFAYKLSRQIGRYAARTRHCEVFLNQDGGRISRDDFVGYYTLMETIKRGRKRVDIERTTESDTRGAGLAGGYLFKLDHIRPHEEHFSAGGMTFSHVYPKRDNLTAAHREWIQSYVDGFAKALYGRAFRDAGRGYAKYIDVDSWIDHHMLNVLTMNVDGLRLSTYLFKERFGRLAMGPIWDLDRTIDSTDKRDDDPIGWKGANDATDYFAYGWWKRLFEDPDFMQRWIDRWAELREEQFSVKNMHDILDRAADKLTVVARRNFKKYPTIEPSGGWKTEIERMKEWLEERVGWIDRQFPEPPRFGRKGGQIEPGFKLEMRAKGGRILYTRDGSDPRQPGGGRAKRAKVLRSGKTITLRKNTKVTARTLQASGKWSPPRSATFIVSPLPVVITEIMFHPTARNSTANAGPAASADEFEFVELFNRGTETVNLAGVRFQKGIEFKFPKGKKSSLEAGEYVVIVGSLAAFKRRYGTRGVRIAGEYRGQLSNAGETLELVGPLDETIQKLRYHDDWYEEADGSGRALTIRDPHGPLESWKKPASWRAAEASPGRAAVPSEEEAADGAES